MYEGILSFGGGLEVPLSARTTLRAQAHYTHLSNGQGLGTHNPAFDGVGGSVGVAWSVGAHEPTIDGEAITRASVGLRAFPLRWPARELGVGFDRIGSPRFGDTSDPYLGVEAQLPVGDGRWQLSIVLERQVSTLDLLGLRFAWGMGPTLRDIARCTVWRPIR